MMSPDYTTLSPVTAEYVLHRMSQYPNGSIFLHKTNQPVLRWVVSMTNHKVVETNLEASVTAVIRLGTQFAGLNEALWERLVIGWWSDESDELYVDLGIAVPGDHQAFQTGLTFVQKAAAFVYAPFRASIVPLESSAICPHCSKHTTHSGGSADVFTN